MQRHGEGESNQLDIADASEYNPKTILIGLLQSGNDSGVVVFVLKETRNEHAHTLS
jgi:hypothetical protein